MYKAWLSWLASGWNGWVFTDDIFITFPEKNIWLFIQISPDLIDNKSTLGQVINYLVPNKWQAVTWTDTDPVSGRVYESPGLDELISNTDMISRLRSQIC